MAVSTCWWGERRADLINDAIMEKSVSYRAKCLMSWNRKKKKKLGATTEEA